MLEKLPKLYRKYGSIEKRLHHHLGRDHYRADTHWCGNTAIETVCCHWCTLRNLGSHIVREPTSARKCELNELDGTPLHYNIYTAFRLTLSHQKAFIYV